MAATAWTGAGKRALARSAVQRTVASSLLTGYKKVKRSPEDLYDVSPLPQVLAWPRARRGRRNPAPSILHVPTPPGSRRRTHSSSTLTPGALAFVVYKPAPAAYTRPPQTERAPSLGVPLDAETPPDAPPSPRNLSRS